MDELYVPEEEWRFRRRVEELFRGDREVIYAVRSCDYYKLRRLLRTYAEMSFSALDVLVAFSSNTDASSALRCRALQARHAPLMVERCEELLRRRGAVCSVCSEVMSPAGSVLVCEGCGGVRRPDDDEGTEDALGGGDFGGGGSGRAPAPSEMAVAGQQEYDNGNGTLVSC